MKIVHVETGRHLYGGAQQVVWLMTGLAAEGVDGMLVCIPGSEIDKAARSADIKVLNIACSGDHDLRFAWKLRRALKQQAPDLVHCHSRRGADFLGGIAARLAGIPAVLSRRVDNRESGFIASWRYRNFRRIIAISENIAAILRENSKIRERVTTIRSAVDVDKFSARIDCTAIRGEFDLNADDFAIVVVAQLIPRKGHRFLFDVVPNLRDQHPHIRVIVFGQGPGEAELRSMVDHMNLSGTVQFAGYCEDLDDYLGCFDLLVHPATEEGLGVAMLKAAAAGLPVVAFDTAGAKEVVAHGTTGVLVPPRDVHRLQKAISVMIEEPQMRRELGQAGQRRMRDEFSIGQMVASHVELYRLVCDEAG